jgi:hypothetical protein
MPLCIRVCLAIDLILMGFEYAVPYLHAWLPLGGNPLTQFAILMCFGVAALEISYRKSGPRLPLLLLGADKPDEPADDHEA